MSNRPVPGGFGRAADLEALRGQADRVFRRSADAPLIAGNSLRVLRDAAENYPAWEDAMRRATSTIHIEMYIIHRDAVGRRFVEILAERARAGIKVRLLYDWFGCGWNPVMGLFRPLVAAGGEVRVFNAPRLAAALAWTTRNHRKYICVDGRVTFIGGLCMGQMWEGRPDRHQDPWRDTGVEIIGPATAHGERGFAASWTFAGGHLEPAVEIPAAMIAETAAGSVDLRLIYTEPFSASMLRVDLLVTAMARRRLWIADAYFVGHGPYVQALQAAAREGVDVRLLLPQGSDVGWTVTVSRTLYRTLIDSGVRIFEWNGSMMHAKTAVADSEWARVGSTNLNLNSWVGNWELDVAIENREIAHQLEAAYENDLAHSTEIVAVSARLHRASPAGSSGRGGRRRRMARRALRTATGVSHAVSAAVMGRRQLEAWESAPLLTVGLLLLAITAIGFWRPWVLALPFALAGLWIGLSFVAQATGLAPRRHN